jgi:GntR family transcriptional regulator, arabinose operon transcriptional repressor
MTVARAAGALERASGGEGGADALPLRYYLCVTLSPDPAPKYRQIFENLKDAIGSGSYQTGQRLPSEAELGKMFSTSRLTVNRALRELQLSGLIERRVGSGSYVSASKCLDLSFGLLIPDLGGTEIFEPICRGMAEVHIGQRHVLLWGRSPADAAAMEAQARESCRQWIGAKVAGAFFAPLELTDRKDAVNSRIARLFETAGIPLILIDRDLVPYPQRSNHDLIGIDNRRAGYVLTEHMLQTGCKRLIFVGRHSAAPSCVARAVGFREAVQDAGAEFRDEFVIHESDPTDVRQVRQLMDELHPDGIVCSNDFTAAQLMQSLDALSIRVPMHVKMGGFDDVKYARFLPVPLTTIHQPCTEIGASAVRAMVERVHNPTLPARDILLDFKLVIRQSTGGSPATIQ